MVSFKAPGVYIREIEVKPPERLRLDIAGFVGQAKRGPLNLPQPLTSWGEYLDIFGGFIGHGYLPYSVFAFFSNGGTRGYVVRVAHESAQKAVLVPDLIDHRGKAIIKIEAINAGAWGNDLEVSAEAESSHDLILTELDDEITKGQGFAKFKSVAGLQDNANSAGKGDRIKLIHPSNPSRQEQRVLASINFAEKTAIFDQAVSHDFPAGTQVLGKGFRLIFRYLRQEQLLRGEVFDNLSMNPEHERYFVRVINGDPEEQDYVKRIRAGNSILARVIDLCRNDAAATGRLEAETAALTGGKDGESRELTTAYFTGYKDGDYFRPPLSQAEDKLFGLSAFEAIEEIGLTAIPDLIIPDFWALAQAAAVFISETGIIFTDLPFDQLDPASLKAGQSDMLRHCEKMGERFAILDSPPGSEIGKGKNKIEDWPDNFQVLPNARYGALYYPWIKEKAANFAGHSLFIPPGGHVAGIYSRSEQGRGVGKAPANEILQGAVELEYCLSDAEQALLNPQGINCLRVLPGRGLRVWGSRTLSLDPLSRYVNIRRVTLAIIKNISVNLRWTVFEPNDQQLWDKITAKLTLFFDDLFARGALVGATVEEAFFVKCDAETNTPDIVDRGQVITEIGFAPARPAEFILVTIKRTPEAVSVVER